MGFKFIHNDYGAPPTRITHILCTNSEAFTAGEAVKLVNGRWTKASGADVPAGIITHNVTAGTDKEAEVQLIREGDVFEAPYEGTPAGGFVPGANAVALDTDGLAVDSATVTGGAIAILSVNTDKATCQLKFKSRQLS